MYLRDASIITGAAIASLFLSGCGSSSLPSGRGPSGTLGISGLVHGGQQPVGGATIQLYAANTTAFKGASTALIGSSVLSDSGGNFAITGDYTCPTPGSLVYLVATGGNPGLPGTVNNAQIAEMATIGTCGSLTSSSYVYVNELTTVAGVESLAPFMADYAHVGTGSNNVNGLSGAFAGAESLVDTTTGQLQAPAAGATVPAELLSTLADIIAACINSPGGSSGSATPCGTLLANSSNPGATETIGALLGIVRSPANNVGPLYGLVSGQSPFQPALTTQPADLLASTSVALPLSPTYGPEFRLMAIDSAQHLWVATPDQTGLTTYATGPITVYDNNGAQLFTVQAGTGGLYLPVQLAGDPFGNMWALNSNATVSKFDPSGNALSPAGGFPVPFNFSASVYNNTSYPHELGQNFMSFDASGNLWGIGSGSVSNCYIELNNAGTVITPNGNFCLGAQNALTAAVASGAPGYAWYVGTGTVSEVNSAGNHVLSGVNSNGCFTDNLVSMLTVENSTQNLLWDSTNNHLWGVGDVNVGVLNANGSQAFCDANGANLPVVTPLSGLVGLTGNVVISSAALDGGGNLWFTTTNQFIGNAPAPVINGGLNGMSSGGTLLTPFNAAGGVFGLQYATANVVGENTNLGEGVAVDASGDIWYISGNASLVKVPGLAVPKVNQ